MVNAGAPSGGSLSTYARGRLGEDALDVLLAPLQERGYVRLRGLLGPGGRADIDFLLIGPTGVYVVDAKKWSGRVTFVDGSLRQDGRRRDHHVESLRGRMHDVRTVLGDELRLTGFPVVGALCFVGEAYVSRHATLPGILICRPDTLLAVFDQLPVQGSRRDVELLRDAAEQKFKARRPTTASPSRKAQEASPAATDPALDVLVANRWQGRGQRRLYVQTIEGKPVGHYCYFAQDFRPEELSLLPLVQIAHHASEERPSRLPSVATDYLAQRPHGLLVALRWLKNGQKRFYFKRVASNGTVEDIGAFDAVHGRVLDASGVSEDLLRELGTRIVVGQPA